MPYRRIFENLRRVFTAFGAELGFEEWYVVNDDYYIEVYLYKEHALRLYAELPDTYLDIYVVPLAADSRANMPNNITRTELAKQVSITNIYNTGYPRCTEMCNSSEATLYSVLERLIEIVRCRPEVLNDFITNIDVNISPLRIQEYARNNLLQSLHFAQQDFADGKTDRMAFESTVNIILKELQKYE